MVRRPSQSVPIALARYDARQEALHGGGGTKHAPEAIYCILYITQHRVMTSQCLRVIGDMKSPPVSRILYTSWIRTLVCNLSDTPRRPRVFLALMLEE